MDNDYDFTIVAIKSELSDSEEDDIALAQIKKFEINVKPEVEEEATLNKNGTTNIKTNAVIASNCQVVDDFIIYEIDEVNTTNVSNTEVLNTSHETSTPATSTIKYPRKRLELSKSDISQQAFQLNNGSMRNEKVRQIKQIKQPQSTTPRIFSIMAADANENIEAVNGVASSRISTSTYQQTREVKDVNIKKTSNLNQCENSSKEKQESISLQHNLYKLQKFRTSSLAASKKTKNSTHALLHNKRAKERTQNFIYAQNISSVIRISPRPDVKVKCACYLKSKNVASEMDAKLELKDFFERMFDEARKLCVDRRKMIKNELLKAVCNAEEDVEAGWHCEKCYTAILTPNERQHPNASTDRSESVQDRPKIYKKKFRNKWLDDDFFKGWLEPVPSNRYKSLCTVCNKVLYSGKSELRKHAKTFTHTANLAKMSENVACKATEA